jgi:ribose transport system ATP-binding protein
MAGEGGSTSTVPVALEAQGLSKRFGAVQALDNVSFYVGEGEVVGLVGENGAGKSTLLSVLSGTTRPDAGEIRLHGHIVNFKSYVEANLAGVFRAHQDQGLIANLTVAENVYLGHEGRFSTAGFLRRREICEAVDRHIAAEIHGRTTARTKVADLPLDLRQLVEIMRAFAVADLLGTGSPIVLLDETTASLNLDEVNDLYRYIRSRRHQASFVFVSHRLREVLELSDRIYVLKDGAVVGQFKPTDVDESLLHSLMVGRVREDKYYREDMRAPCTGDAVLEATRISAPAFFREISLYIRSGEILTMGGVTGSGKTEVARALAGDLKFSSGTVSFAGAPLPRVGVRSRLGLIGYGPLDRHAEGVILQHSVERNVTLSCLDQLAQPPGFVSPRAGRARGRAVISEFGIVTPTERNLVASLSGGNQQKVMLARLVQSDCAVLVLDNPTRGVDAGARQEIYAQLRTLTARGVGILLVSDDLHELIGLGDRIAIMRDGELVHTFEDVRSSPPSEEEVVGKML